MTYFIQILTGTLGAFGFAILYNLRGTKLLIATLGGALSWGTYLFSEYGFTVSRSGIFCGNRSYDLCRDICKN